MFVFSSFRKCEKYDFAFLCQILIIMGNHKDVIKAVKGKNFHFTLGQPAIMNFFLVCIVALLLLFTRAVRTRKIKGSP